MRILICLVCLSLFTHDREENNPEFTPYIQAFLEEGAKRVEHLEGRISRMNIKFGDLAEGIDGSCKRKGKNSLITIDGSIWRRLDSLQKQALIFHEMGHCLLGRKHTNQELPRGECASLMVEKQDTSTCYYNFYANEWRAYYLDELFAENIGIPEWYAEALLASFSSRSLFQKPFHPTNS